MVFNFNNKGKRQCRAIGIDLGTTNSCVGVWQNGGVKIIPNENGNQTTPSCVAFTKTKLLIGDAAKNQLGSNPANTIYGAKRLIGRTFKEDEFHHNTKRWPFKVVAGPGTDTDKRPMIELSHQGDQRRFTAELVSAMILTKMKKIAESYLGSKVNDAVITVPTNFNQKQWQAIKDAADFAGLNVSRIIPEPVAAAVTYAANIKTQNLTENVLVFDFGGATLDVSIVAIKNDMFEVIASDGDAYLGGDDVDDALVGYFVAKFERKHGKNIGKNPKALARLRSSCERAKKILSWELQTRIEIDGLYECIDFSSMVNRPLLDELNDGLFNRCIDCVRNCLKLAKMSEDCINTVVLVGGSSRIPKVQEMLKGFFKRDVLYRGLNPEVLGAYGAAIISDMMSAGGSNGSESEVADVIPRSLGIEVYGGGMSKVVPKHTSLPVTMYKWYKTSVDNQTVARFPVYEGEKSVAKENSYLNEFKLFDVPKAPKGTEKFDVCFDINTNGDLTVSATHRGTSNQKEIAITNHSKPLLKINLGSRKIKGRMNKKVKDDIQHKELVKHNNNYFQEFAGTMMNQIHKKLKQIGFLNCFVIRD